MKKITNSILSLLLIIILIPIFIIIYIAILIEDGHPVIFKQERFGKDMKSFNIYKFRSMKIHEEKEFIVTKENDNRILKTGKFLRKTRLDELPQLFNILFGQMTFVGVRPDIYSHIEYYNEEQKKEYYINYLLSEKCKLNKIYNDNKCFILDVKILLASFNLIRQVKINGIVYKPKMWRYTFLNYRILYKL